MSQLARYRTALEPFTEEWVALAHAQLSISEKREHGFITLRGELHSAAVQQDYACLGLTAVELHRRSESASVVGLPG